MDSPQTTATAPTIPPAAIIPAPPADEGVTAGITTKGGWALVQRVAQAFAASTLVPDQYRGKDGLPNCIIAVNMAQRMGADPLMVMQNLYVVHGRPAWSSQFLTATFNQSGRFSALRYQFAGEPGKPDWGCRAWAMEKATGERLEGPLVTIAMAAAEGWSSRAGSKWKTLPELMLRYRAATFFVRTYAPELSMGLQTVEEVKDTIDVQAERVTAGKGARPPVAPEPPPAGAPAPADTFAPDGSHDSDELNMGAK